MHSLHYPLLVLAGAVAGGLNALAGGGSFITLPMLMFSGATPVRANTTSTLALWPAIAASLFAYRRDLAKRSHPLWLYAVMALIGGALGAFLLLRSSNGFFLALLPYLLLIATLLFAFGNRLTAWVASRGDPKTDGTDETHGPPPRAAAYALLFLIAVYGGYFGGGMGIMTLAVLTLLGMRDIHEMNALKALWGMSINAVAVVIFVAMGEIDWPRCLVMMAGSIGGGYLAGRYAHGVPQIWVRRFILTVASGMTLYYFLHGRA